MWIPLDSINTKEQHGGLAYVSRKILSPRHYFDIVYQLVQQENISELSQTEDFKKWNFQYASPIETLILDTNKVEDDFEVGDALVIDKLIWHKSCTLKEGVLPSRMAYVVRFVDSQARYSKVFVEGSLSILSNDVQFKHRNLFDKLANFLKDGEIISDNLVN